jgi:hypothetical protein
MYIYIYDVDTMGCNADNLITWDTMLSFGVVTSQNGDVNPKIGKNG